MKFDVPEWVLLAISICAGYLLLSGFARALRRRGEREFVRQTLELLALATQRQTAMAPVLRRAASCVRRRESRRLDVIADTLDAGRPIADALTAARVFPRHVVAAIEAVDGRAGLARVLRSLADEQDTLEGLRYRMSVTTAYPALLAVILLAFSWHATTAQQRLASTLEGGVADVGPGRMIAILAAALALFVWWSITTRNGVVQRLLGRAPWVGPRLRLLATARWLRALSVRIEDGSPLGVALRDSGAAADHPSLEADVRAAAEGAERGGRLEDVWSRVRAPGFVLAQLQSSASAGPAELAGRVRDAAERCVQRATESFARAQRQFQVAALLVFGVAIAMQWSGVFAWLERVRNAAVEQMPW